MTQICGFHHVSLPASDLDRSSDWYERVFGFRRVLIEEDETTSPWSCSSTQRECYFCLHQSPDLNRAWHGPGSTVAVLSFRVASRAALVAWDKRLAELGAQHSGPRQARLGWALDVTDASGLRIQLHTYEAISADDT